MARRSGAGAWVGIGGWLAVAGAVLVACVGDSPVTPAPGVDAGSDVTAQNDTGVGNDATTPSDSASDVVATGDASDGGCGLPKKLCSGTCVDITTDQDNCGACGKGCTVNEKCLTSLCCATGSVICNSVCTDTSSDMNNCGACGTGCKLGSPCIQGKCAFKVGNYTALPDPSSHSSNYLLGFTITVPSAGKLLDFGVISKAAGPNLIMALYTDASGSPGTLVASSPNIVLNGSDQMVTANPQAALSAGTYWIVGVSDVTANIASNASANIAVKYTALTFGSALPSTFPAATAGTSQLSNYYLRMQ